MTSLNPLHTIEKQLGESLALHQGIAGDKARHAQETGAATILAGDLGCLMNIAGKLSREGRPVKARHVVEVLAGMTDVPAIGEA